MTFLELIIYFGLGVCGLAFLFGRKSRLNNYPPGPWGIPVLGHLPLLGQRPHNTLINWSKRYGQIFSIQMGSFPAVVINDAKLIKAAFNDFAYSGRPRFPMFKAKCNGVVEGVALTDGPKWHEQRRFILRTLRDFGFGKKSMEVIVQEEIKDLIETMRKMNGKVLEYPHNMFHVAVLNALWTIIAGERFKQDDPELQIAIKHLASSSSHLNMRAMISNMYPVLARVAPELSGFNKLIEVFLPILEFLNPLPHIGPRFKMDNDGTSLMFIWRKSTKLRIQIPVSTNHKDTSPFYILFLSRDCEHDSAMDTSLPGQIHRIPVSTPSGDPESCGKQSTPFFE